MGMRGMKAAIDTIFLLHDNSAMKNVTITVEEEVLQWARVQAAVHNTSISRMLGECLRQQMRHTLDYDAAQRQFLMRKARTLKKTRSAYPKRNDLYD